MKIKSLMGIGLMLTLTGMMAGCGLDHSDAAPSVTTQQAAYGGSALQGPVNDGLVIAKKVGNTDFSKVENVSAGVPEDSVRTANDGTGKFSFTKVPAYPHTLVMVAGSGKDALTNKPNIQMFAKSGSTYITPLTTLVASATDAATSAAIEAKLVAIAGMPVGTSIGDVDTTNTTAAAMVVTKSIESAVTAMGATVSAAAATTSKTVSDAQASVVQSQTLQALAAAVNNASTAQLSTPKSLNDVVITPALTSAVNTIDNTSSNLNITASSSAVAVATALATAAVDASAKAINGASSGSSDTTRVGTGTTADTKLAESTKINTTTTAQVPAATITTTAANLTVTAAFTSTDIVNAPVVHTALAPAITSSVLTIPQSGSTTIVITFNHAIDTSVGTITVGGVALTPSYSADKTFATVTLASKPAAGATVAVVVSGYKAGSLTPAELAASYAAAMEPTSYAHTVPAGIVTGATGSSSINF